MASLRTASSAARLLRGVSQHFVPAVRRFESTSSQNELTPATTPSSDPDHTVKVDKATS
jgi:hypothetical protein